MKERPINFNAEMVRAIQDSHKTQTRRVIKPQINFIYRLTGDSLSCMLYAGKEVSNENEGWCYVARNPSIAERGLPCGKRWANLLSDEICRIWKEGLRGLVCFTWPQDGEGIFRGFIVPQKQKGDEINSSNDMHGIPRNASDSETSNEASGRKQQKQSSEKSMLGNTNRELAGQESTRQGNRGREASRSEVQKCGTGAYPMGCEKEFMQSKTCRTNAWRKSGIYLRNCPFEIGLRLWVKETFYDDYAIGGQDENGKRIDIIYRADYINNNHAIGIKWKPSIHMPRWASRILLEIVDIRVERVQDITATDAREEGSEDINKEEVTNGHTTAWCGDIVAGFRKLWDSINKKRGYGWSVNPWVWVIEFKRINP